MRPKLSAHLIQIHGLMKVEVDVCSTRHAKVNKQVAWAVTSGFPTLFYTTHFDRRLVNA